MGLDYGGEGGSYSYPTYGTGIGGPVPGGELDGYGSGVEGGEQDPGYEQEVPQTTTESSFFGLRASSIFGGDDDDCAVKPLRARIPNSFACDDHNPRTSWKVHIIEHRRIGHNDFGLNGSSSVQLGITGPGLPVNRWKLKIWEIQKDTQNRGT